MIPVQNRPLLLSAQVTLAPGATQEPPTDRLVNPLNTAMLIDEIRFKAPLINDLPNPWLMSPLLSMRCELRMGRISITNGSVPIGNFGKVTLEDTGSALNFPIGGSPQACVTTHSVWKLPKPLYVPRGEFLIPRLTYDVRYNAYVRSNVALPTTSLTLDISYAGRSLPPDFPVPATIAVPWVTNFDIPILALTDGNSDTTISNQTQLVNPFDKPMFVQRFIGRTLLAGVAQQVEIGIAAGSSVPWTMTTVRAMDSLNNILVRDPTPFAHLFQYLDRSWTVNSQLPSQGFYIFTVDRKYTATNSQAALAHAISMVGYREVELQ